MTVAGVAVRRGLANAGVSTGSREPRAGGWCGSWALGQAGNGGIASAVRRSPSE